MAAEGGQSPGQPGSTRTRYCSVRMVKDKALAEASALIILKKKAAEIWGWEAEDGGTSGENES